MPATASKAPTHIAYHVREREGGKGFFPCIGVAWLHQDGKGFNIQLDIMPLYGFVSLRVPSDNPTAELSTTGRAARSAHPLHPPKEIFNMHTSANPFYAARCGIAA